MRVVVDDPHEVVEQFTDEQLVHSQRPGLPGPAWTKVGLGLETPQEEDGGEALLHQVRRLPAGPRVVGHEVVGRQDVTGVVQLLPPQAQALVVLLQPWCQLPPLLEAPARQESEGQEPGPAATAVETILQETLLAVGPGLGQPQAGGRTEPASMESDFYYKYQKII